MTLVWSKIVRLGQWEPIDSEEMIHPSELEGRVMSTERNGRHVQRLADSILHHGYSPERHGQLGLNLTDHGENIYHHSSGTETDPEDHLHHEHLLQALKDVGHGEVPVHIHDQQSDPEGEAAPRYYHGTTESLDEVRPNHSTRGTFGPSTHAPGYAYATGLESAKGYAERAADMHGGHPRVYEVHPLGPVEDDPKFDAAGYNRGSNLDDKRSRHGFAVVDQVDLGHGHDLD